MLIISYTEGDIKKVLAIYCFMAMWDLIVFYDSTQTYAMWMLYQQRSPDGEDT